LTIRLICTLDDRSLAVRGAEWRTLFAEASSREAIEEGARLVFPADVSLQERLQHLIEAESECCAWMTFDVAEVGEQVVVTVSGPPDTRAALAVTFAGGRRPPPDGGGRSGERPLVDWPPA
jgi:hypothetical protein